MRENPERFFQVPTIDGLTRGKHAKFLSRGLYEKTHKGFISKPLKLSVLHKYPRETVLRKSFS